MIYYTPNTPLFRGSMKPLSDDKNIKIGLDVGKGKDYTCIHNHQKKQEKFLHKSDLEDFK